MDPTPEQAPTQTREPAATASQWRRGGTSRRRRLAVLVVLAVLVGWLANVGCQTIAAARLLRDAVRPAHELAGLVLESEEHVDGVAVLVYRPRGPLAPLPGLVLCHGAVESGAYDPRLIALARALALRGFHVACPDLPSLRAFRADPEDVDHLERLALSLAGDSERVDAEHLSLAGISIGGSYCLVAAARPDLREQVDAVLAFGAYDDLGQLVRSWMVAPRPGVPELYDPLVEGRRRVLLGNLDGLLPPVDRDVVRGWLLDLLAGETSVAPNAPDLSEDAARLVACAVSTEPIDPALTDAVLAPMQATLRALSPARDGHAPAATVFLLHGEGDPIVPPSDTAALRATLEPCGTTVRAHVTDAFSHVTVGESPSFLTSWSLVWFVARFLVAAGV